MTDLKKKVANGLNETRTLILGAQILLGFQFTAVFQPGFERLAPHSQWLNSAGLGLMIAAVGLLIAPAPFHRIAEHRRDTERLHGFTTAMAEYALIPFACCIGIDAFIVAETLFGMTPGIVAGIAFSAVAVLFWYGIEIPHRNRGAQSMEQRQPNDKSSGGDLSEKITTLMTETRVILPGAQALLGFQFTAFLTDGFAHLPPTAKLVHFAALACVALSTVLLIAPAAYHRLAARGEDRPDVDRFGSAAMLAALPFLALGIGGEFYIVVGKMDGGGGIAAIAALVALAAFLSLWFAYPLVARVRRRDYRAAE